MRCIKCNHTVCLRCGVIFNNQLFCSLGCARLCLLFFYFKTMNHIFCAELPHNLPEGMLHLYIKLDDTFTLFSSFESGPVGWCRRAWRTGKAEKVSRLFKSLSSIVPNTARNPREPTKTKGKGLSVWKISLYKILSSLQDTKNPKKGLHWGLCIILLWSFS